MDITRIYIDREFSLGEILELTESSASHLFKALRKRIGDEIELFNGRGYSCNAVILDSLKNNQTAKVTSKPILHKKQGTEINVGMALIKNDPFSLAVQKSAELGVNSLTPLITERTQVRLKNIKENKIDRWNSIARGACEQCGENWVTDIKDPLNLLDWSNNLTSPLKLALYPKSKKKITEVSIEGPVALAIGPAGDFSEEEILTLEERGFVPVSMGHRILRAETALISALSCIRTMTEEF